MEKKEKLQTCWCAKLLGCDPKILRCMSVLNNLLSSSFVFAVRLRRKKEGKKERAKRRRFNALLGWDL